MGGSLRSGERKEWEAEDCELAGETTGDGESIDFLPSESIFWQRCSVLIPIKALLCPLPSSESEEEEREYFDTLPWSASKEIGYSIYLPHEREWYILPLHLRLRLEN